MNWYDNCLRLTRQTTNASSRPVHLLTTFPFLVLETVLQASHQDKKTLGVRFLPAYCIEPNLFF